MFRIYSHKLTRIVSENNAKPHTPLISIYDVNQVAIQLNSDITIHMTCDEFDLLSDCTNKNICAICGINYANLFKIIALYRKGKMSRLDVEMEITHGDYIYA